MARRRLVHGDAAAAGARGLVARRVARRRRYRTHRMLVVHGGGPCHVDREPAVSDAAAARGHQARGRRRPVHVACAVPDSGWLSTRSCLREVEPAPAHGSLRGVEVECPTTGAAARHHECHGLHVDVGQQFGDHRHDAADCHGRARCGRRHGGRSSDRRGPTELRGGHDPVGVVRLEHRRLRHTDRYAGQFDRDGHP